MDVFCPWPVFVCLLNEEFLILGMKDMVRKSIVIGLAAMQLAVCGCGPHGAQEPPANGAEAPAAGTEGPREEQAETDNQETVKQLSYLPAADDFGNLQLKDPSVPVYDTYTIAERRKKGLPLRLPELKPWHERKTAYLTFDDGPDDVNTPAILDILQQEQVKGTFYVTGRAVQAYPEITKRIFREGHALGNHSYDHDYDRLYASVDNYLSEMEEADEVLYGVLGMRPLITRAPGGRMGHFDSSYAAAVEAAGYVEHDWNVSSADTAPNHPVAQDFMDNIEGQADMESAIILMHCSSGHEETVKALPGIIRILREKGYAFGVVTPMTPQPW